MKSVEVVGVETQVGWGVMLTSDTPVHTCAHGVGEGVVVPLPTLAGQWAHWKLSVGAFWEW